MRARNFWIMLLRIPFHILQVNPFYVAMYVSCGYVYSVQLKSEFWIFFALSQIKNEKSGDMYFQFTQIHMHIISYFIFFIIVP